MSEDSKSADINNMTSALSSRSERHYISFLSVLFPQRPKSSSQKCIVHVSLPCPLAATTCTPTASCVSACTWTTSFKNNKQSTDRRRSCVGTLCWVFLGCPGCRDLWRDSSWVSTWCRVAARWSRPGPDTSRYPAARSSRPRLKSARTRWSGRSWRPAAREENENTVKQWRPLSPRREIKYTLSYQLDN